MKWSPAQVFTASKKLTNRYQERKVKYTVGM